MKKPTDITLTTSSHYRQFIEELKACVVAARTSAARAVNNDLKSAIIHSMASKKSKAAGGNPTKSTAGVQTSSGKAVLLLARPAKKPSPPSPSIAELNAKMDADSARITRLARANTQRLSGKPVL
jgi:hypothetical protein